MPHHHTFYELIINKARGEPQRAAPFRRLARHRCGSESK
jgi:hypothetical protein